MLVTQVFAVVCTSTCSILSVRSVLFCVYFAILLLLIQDYFSYKIIRLSIIPDLFFGIESSTLHSRDVFHIE